MNYVNQFISGFIGALIFCLCLPVTAQNAGTDCQVEINRAKVNPVTIWGGKSTAREVEDNAKLYLGVSCSKVDVAAERRLVETNESTLRKIPESQMDRPDVLGLRLTICIQRAVANRCGSGVAASESNQGSRPNTPAGGNPSTSTSGNSALPQTEAINLANKSQAEADKVRSDAASALAWTKIAQEAVDKARQGKPKRHVVAREAHNCLRPQTGGGVINDCPYAVEYSYCVLRPEPNSYSDWFACGKNIGSWQIGAGPNTRAIMHTAGQATYWFACRYGDSLSKPDGVSPVDLEFQAGRGLLGRCAEWGSGGKSR